MKLILRNLIAIAALMLGSGVFAAPMNLEGLAKSSANGVAGIPGVASGTFDPPPAGSVSKSSFAADGFDHFSSSSFFGNTGGQFAVSAEGSGTYPRRY